MSNRHPQTLPLAAKFEQAIAHHQAGRLQAAEQLYRAILQVEPNRAEVNHNLGVIAAQMGQPAQGLPFLKAAVMLNPAHGQYAQSYADALLAANQAQEASDFIQAALERGHNTPVMHSLQQKAKKAALTGSIDSETPSVDEINQLLALFSASRHIEVEALAALLIEKHPNFGPAWKALGVSLEMQGLDPLFALQKAAKLLPNDPEVHNHLGVKLMDRKHPEDAVASYRHALAINPNFIEALCNLSNSLGEIGQFEEAAACARRALLINPDCAEASMFLGNALRGLKQLNAAVECYRLAIKIKPDFSDTYINLGLALKDLKQYEAALSSYRQAVVVKPESFQAHLQLGLALIELGYNDKGLESCLQATQLQADKNESDTAEAYVALLYAMSQSEAVDAVELFKAHCRFGEQFEAPLRANWPKHANERNPERRLQIGFVSGDLNSHSIARFIGPVLAQLSSQPLLSLHAYYNKTSEDDETHRLKKNLAHWHPIAKLSDDALAQKIRDDGIDILIDLSGHTSHNRLLTFARKPAPLQVTWMGFPGTTGLQAMDYYFTDAFGLPPGRFDDQFTEKLVHLPASAPFLPFADSPPVNQLPALSNGYVTFGSFNRSNKINRSVIALWAKTLHALPDSRMLLGAMLPGENTLINKMFALEGIGQDRLIFHTQTGMKTYLALHHQVDICLDTFPYNGGTTTLHALWMGVPTLTRSGQTALSRTGASVLGHIGLQMFDSENVEDFVLNAKYWAGNLAKLSDIRSDLRQRFAQSVIGQPEVVAAGLQQAFRTMWQRWCHNLPTETFKVAKQDIGNLPTESSK